MPAGSVALNQMRPVGGGLIRLGPEVGYPGDPAVVAEVEEAQPGLGAVPGGEPPDPARRVLALTDGPLHGDMPVAGEALGAETHERFPALDPLTCLRNLVEHVPGDQACERSPVPGPDRLPVGHYCLLRAGHVRNLSPGWDSRPVGPCDHGPGRDHARGWPPRPIMV